MYASDRPLRLWRPQWWAWWVLFGILRLLILLPISLQWDIARLLGSVMRLVLRRRSKIIYDNLNLCFPDKSTKEINHIHRINFHHMAFMFFESAMSWWGGEQLHKLIKRVENIELVSALHQEGKGVILLGGHFITMELIGAYVAQQLPLTINYRKGDHPLLEYISLSGRLNNFYSAEPKENIKAMVRLLRRGGVLWYAPDQRYSGDMKTWVEFFGHQVTAVQATEQIAKLGKAEVIKIAFWRESDGRYVIRFEPQETTETSKLSHTQEYFYFLERYIRLHPEQYLWAHRRFGGLVRY